VTAYEDLYFYCLKTHVIAHSLLRDGQVESTEKVLFNALKANRKEIESRSLKGGKWRDLYNSVEGEF
jgi:hypothetical protein